MFKKINQPPNWKLPDSGMGLGQPVSGGWQQGRGRQAKRDGKEPAQTLAKGEKGNKGPEEQPNAAADSKKSAIQKPVFSDHQ